MCLSAGNPLFQSADLFSPDPNANPLFSPATAGTGAPPSSAIGLRRLGGLPLSQLGAGAAAATARASPGAGSDGEAAMMDAEGGEQQPPAASLAAAGSPGGAAAGAAASDRPEEEEFAGVLGAGEHDTAQRDIWVSGWRCGRAGRRLHGA